MGDAPAGERPIAEITTDCEVVAAVPILRSKLKDRIGFKIARFSSPLVEEIASPSAGSDQHVFWSLAMGAAVKSGVAQARLEKGSGAELVKIGDAP